MNKERIISFTAFICILIIEVLIALFVRDKFIRPYMGDVLVIPLIYFFVRFLFGRKVKLLPLYIFIFAVAVELLQYIDILSILNLGHIGWLRIVAGGTFDYKDILCYFAGSCVSYAIDLRL